MNEMNESDLDPDHAALWAAIGELYRADEAACVGTLLADARLVPPMAEAVDGRARRLVEHIRAERRLVGGLDIFLHEYGLGTAEGVVLMCLAEALLRIPDEETAARLIRDKIGAAAWAEHLGHSASLLVNASTWGLMLTGKLVRLRESDPADTWKSLQALIARAGEPVVRRALLHAMRILGRQFVIGHTIEEALRRAKQARAAASFDMLGEAAHTANDAERYFAAYEAAITTLGRSTSGAEHGISVKLSAIHPRYEFSQHDRVMAELVPRLRTLALQAKHHGIALTVDAEEADRLALSLDVFSGVFSDTALDGWEGFGLAVQAYQKRAPAVIDWLAALARQAGRRIQIRLVKGAYWDTEIKRAQERGLDGYPVFTRKPATDVSYIACARRLLASRDVFYPQFATHNARTVATVMALAGVWRGFEFQRLHGMGEALYAALEAEPEAAPPCRIYCPVGSHEDLLPYLVRRLLENGANTSFVNRLADDAAPIDDVVRDPLEELGPLPYRPHAGIGLPADLYGDARRNSAGVDLSDIRVVEPLLRQMGAAAAQHWEALPIVDGESIETVRVPVHDPADSRRTIGTVHEADVALARRAIDVAVSQTESWAATPVDERAAVLEKFADLLEARQAEVMALCVREAGKTVADAVSEVRETVDYGRYYAMCARRDFAEPTGLPGPTGEKNSIALSGRGAFVCISPWNFPLAIFTGQVAAALASGNTVIAKPAEQTALTACFATRLLHEAGVPPGVLQFVPGRGETIGGALAGDPRIAGVAFTGSTETARLIARTLAERAGPIVPLIAETGGQNAMIVDSSALTEQVVADVLQSAFYGAGQRCSCLRVLFLQAEIAPRVLTMLSGAMAELRLGDPMQLSTDIGPVIDEAALEALRGHAARISRTGTVHAQTPGGEATVHGTFFRPLVVEIDGIGVLEREVFGPILHVVRYGTDRLDAVIDAVNATGYGLTLGVHSRLGSTVKHVVARARVGNIYINRNMVGAVVGVQPFGGEGFSGTGPKAGGPRYLHRFATERTIAINTVAAGGDTALLSLSDDDTGNSVGYSPEAP